MNYIISSIPFPAIFGLLGICFLIELYTFIKYFSTYNISYKLILCSAMGFTVLLLLGKTLQRFQVLSGAEQIFNISAIISFVLFLIFLLKVSIPKMMKHSATKIILFLFLFALVGSFALALLIIFR